MSDEPREVAQRSTTIAWADPGVALSQFPQLSGRAFVEAARCGDLPMPPIAALMAFALVHVEDGRVVLESTPGEHLQNPLGVIHGGYAATLLDTAMGCAVHTLLDAGTAFITLELKVNYIRPLLADTGPLTVEGRVVHGGTKMATADASMRDSATEKLIAHATSTLLRVRPANGD